MTLFHDPDDPDDPDDPAAPPIPERLSFKALREAAQECRACELWQGATQAVMGAGSPPTKARLMLVGEQHFRYKLRGKRRIHQTPERVRVTACRPWLDAELKLVKPEAPVCLGATAAHALLGSSVRIGRDRGRRMESDLAEHVTLTTHPSAILRQRGDADRAAAMDAFVEDLAHVARWLAHN